MEYSKKSSQSPQFATTSPYKHIDLVVGHWSSIFDSSQGNLYEFESCTQHFPVCYCSPMAQGISFGCCSLLRAAISVGFVCYFLLFLVGYLLYLQHLNFQRCSSILIDLLISLPGITSCSLVECISNSILVVFLEVFFREEVPCSYFVSYLLIITSSSYF